MNLLNDDEQVSKRDVRLAQSIAARLPGVLSKRRLPAPFSGFFLTRSQGLTFFFAVLDTGQVEYLERYTSKELLHQMSTEIGGLPVYLSNSTGLRYAVLLSARPHLPRQVQLPGEIGSGQVGLGVRMDGQHVLVPWVRLGHVLTAGMTGSGKSVFLRSLVYQAVRDGMQLLLADMDQATFPMMVGHEALLAPLATSAADAAQLIERALAECDNRAALFQKAQGYPENLEEYNQHAVEKLQRVLVVLDEFSAVASAVPQLKERIAALGWRGRKFGLHVVFAAQEFTKDLVGPLRDQVNLALCFRVRSAEMAKRVGCAGAESIAANRPGLAMTDRWGPIQTYYVNKALLAEAPILGMTEEDQLAYATGINAGGHISIPLLVAEGLSEWKARQLLNRWELRGWIIRDGQNRRISAKLARILSNPQTPQIASNLSSHLKEKENAESAF